MVLQISSSEMLCSMETTAVVIFKYVLELLFLESVNSTVKSMCDMLTHQLNQKPFERPFFNS